MTYPTRHCHNCGEPYQPRRVDQNYCGRPCLVEAQNRELLRAKKLYRELYHWRKARGSGRMGKLLGDVSRVMDEFIAEDRRRGRPAPPLPERIAQEDYMDMIRARGVKGA